MDQKSWKNNIPSLLIMYSILAAIDGIFLIYALSADNKIESITLFVIVLSLFFSILFFIISGEGITDALDENDAEKCVSFYVPYNIAVILLFFGIFAIIDYKFSLNRFFFYVLPCNPIFLKIIIFLFITRKWWGYRGLRFLFFANEGEYNNYISELMIGNEQCEQNKQPIPDHGFWFLLFKDIRGWSLVRKVGSLFDIFDNMCQCIMNYLFKDVCILLKEFKCKNYKFHGDLIDLRPSKIHGVGVFAVQNIKAGVLVAEGIHEDDYKEIVLWESIKNVSPFIERKIKDFCIGTPEGFIPPEDYDFSKLTVEWYMNHSCNGNIGFNTVGDFIAIKDIEHDEEVTYDYGLAESNPLFKISACNCGSSNCRHSITGNDWKNSEFRNKNIKYMLPKLRIVSL